MGYETQSHEPRMSVGTQYHKVLQMPLHFIFLSSKLFVTSEIDRDGGEVVLSTVRFETLSKATNLYETNFLVTWI